MSGKKMNTKQQPSTAFSITNIRNSILQKIQQSSQNCPDGESRQPIQSEMPSAASDRQITKKYSSITCGEQTDSLCSGGGRLLPVDAGTEIKTVKHSEEEGDCNSTNETNCSKRLVLPTDLENDAETKTQDILLMLKTENAEAHMDNETPANTDSAKSCTSHQVHLCTAADCECSSNVTDMNNKLSENEKVADLGTESSLSCGRLLGVRDCASTSCQEDNDIVVSGVEKLEERFEEKKMQWDDTDIAVTKEEYTTQDCNSRSDDADIVITKEEYRTQDSNSEYEGEETQSPDSDTDTSSLSDEDQGVLATKKKGVQGEASDEESDKNLKKNRFGLEDIRTTGELYPEELPPIEELTIDVDANTQMEEVGVVSGVVGVLVVIHSRPGHSPVQDDTVFFLENRTPIGQVFEVFGPVVRPYYSVRFNSPDDIEKKGIQMGLPVYFAPEMPEITHYIFVEQLKRLKGSDASWKDNNEPPPEMIDYSDDEEERRAKAKRRGRCEAEVEEAPDSPESSSTSAPTGQKKLRNWRKKNHGDTSKTSSGEPSAPSGRWPPSDRFSKRFSGNSPRMSLRHDGPADTSSNNQGHWRRACGQAMLRGPVFSAPTCSTSFREAGPLASHNLFSPSHNRPQHPSVNTPPPPYYNFSHNPPPAAMQPFFQNGAPSFANGGFSQQAPPGFGSGPTFNRGPSHFSRPPPPSWKKDFQPSPSSSGPWNPQQNQGNWSQNPTLSGTWVQNGQQHTAGVDGWGRALGQTSTGTCSSTHAAPILDTRFMNG